MRIASVLFFIVKVFLVLMSLATFRIMSVNIKRGFVCGDQTLSLERKPDTVSNLALGIWIFTPVLIVVIGELIFNRKSEEKVTTTLQKSARNIRFLVYRYILNLLMMNIIMLAVKFFTGAHRPTFFETCKPNTMFNCTVGNYVPTFVCTNEEMTRIDILDASWSFLSGHASNCVFSCFFVIWYIEERIKRNSLFFAIFLQTILVCLAFYGSISRVFDHRHHWWDVLAGAILGLLAVYHTEFKLKKVIRWIIPELNVKTRNGTSKESNTAVLSYDQNVTSWSIRLYPNGDTPNANQHVSLYLISRSAGSRDFLAKWRFTLQNDQGVEVIQNSAEERGNKLIPGLGYDKFIYHQELFKHVKNCSSVTIICELSIYGPKKQNEGKASLSLPIQHDLRKMFEDEIFCDLDIKANDGIILRAHRSILSARSAVIMKMLTTDMKEAKINKVEIDDFDSKIIREMLRFIYCGQVNHFESIAKQLIYAAEKYEVTELKEKCIEEIASKVSKENVIETLIIADQISGAEKLAIACVPTISIYLREVSKDPKWKQLSNGMLNQLMLKIWENSYARDV